MIPLHGYSRDLGLGLVLKPNSITLAGLELVRSWFEAGSKLHMVRAEIWPII